MTDKQIITEIHQPGNIIGLIPALKLEGWYDSELSISDHGTLFIHGRKTAKQKYARPKTPRT